MKITDVETELRKMAAILAGTSQGATCALAADIVREHGQWQHEREHGPLRTVQAKLWRMADAKASESTLKAHMTALHTNLERFPATNATP